MKVQSLYLKKLSSLSKWRLLPKLLFNLIFNINYSPVKKTHTTYKLLYWIQDVYTPFEKRWLFGYVFVTQIGKITIHVGNNKHIGFHSKLLNMSHPCISIVNICSDYYY